MKTTARLVFTAIFGMSALFVSANITGDLDESNVEKDVAKSSTNIASAVAPVIDFQTFTLEEELYIDDIPFDTQEVSREISSDVFKVGFQIDSQFYLEEENYIDDIPFDTANISQKALSK